MGAQDGVQAIPKSWRGHLECEALIRKLSQCLYDHSQASREACH